MLCYKNLRQKFQLSITNESEKFTFQRTDVQMVGHFNYKEGSLLKIEKKKKDYIYSDNEFRPDNNFRCKERTVQ